ncbi:MAG: hypothetical protein QFX32_01175 [Methanolinea sp.]|nr:hypothetical protein [Methanolinea sp.]
MSALADLSRAILFLFTFALAVPLLTGAILGIPESRILPLIASAFVLQGAAPPLGHPLGLSDPVIIFLMASFAVGVVTCILEICDALSVTSERLARWIRKVGEIMEKHPSIRSYGAISCIFIAWIPGIGLYGTPVIAWILGWPKAPTIIFTTAGFVIASGLVLTVTVFAENIHRALS